MYECVDRSSLWCLVGVTEGQLLEGPAQLILLAALACIGSFLPRGKRTGSPAQQPFGRYLRAHLVVWA